MKRKAIPSTRPPIATPIMPFALSFARKGKTSVGLVLATRVRRHARALLPRRSPERVPVSKKPSWRFPPPAFTATFARRQTKPPEGAYSPRGGGEGCPGRHG